MRGITLATIASLLGAHAVLAQDATWKGLTSEWSVSTNWSPANVPTGRATFTTGAGTTNVAINSSAVSIGALLFTSSAPNYSFDINKKFEINGSGITNNSISFLDFLVRDQGSLYLLNSSSAGNIRIKSTGNIFLANNSIASSATITNSSGLQFSDRSSAGSARIFNLLPGAVEFNNSSTAGQATITNDSSVAFNNSSTAGNATITNGYSVAFNNSSTAGNATITNNNTVTFGQNSSAGNATIINNGYLSFGGNSTGDNAAISNGAATAVVDFSQSAGPNGDHKLSVGSLAGIGKFNLGANQLTVGGNNLSTTVSGVISDCGPGLQGCGSLTKTGTGTLTLTGANVYIGGTTVAAGKLQLGNGGATGSITGNVSFLNNTSSIVFNRSNSYVFDGRLDGSGSVAQVGTGTTVLTANNGYSLGTTITAGILQVGNGGASGSLGTGNVVNNARLVFNRTDTVFVVANLISGSGAVTQIGSGTTVLTGTNTHTGGTTISAGTLQLGNGGTSGSIVGNITNNANLAINRSDTVTFGGVISGSGAFQQLGTGTTILTGSNTYTGGTTILSGTLQIGTGIILPVSAGGPGSIVGNVLNNATLIFARPDAYTFGGNISGTGAVIVGGISPGTLTLSGNNTYSGGTTIRGFSTLAVSSDTNLGAGSGGLHFQGGTLRFLSSFETSRSVTIDIRGAVIDVGSNTSTMSGVISSAGSLGGGLFKTGTGTLILSGNSTYSGGTTIAAGTLQLGSGGTAGSIVGDVVNNAAAAFNRTDATTFGGVISGTGSISQIGGGTTTLTAISTYTGATNVSAGTLSVNGSIASSSLTTVNAGGTLDGNGTVGNTTINGGTLAPGNSIGTLTVQGNLVFTAAASYMVEVSPASADRTNVTGTATLGNATVKAHFAPGTYVAKQYTIINASGGIIGAFGSQANTDLPANFRSSLSFDTNNAYLNLALNFIPPPGSGLNANQQNVANAIVGYFNSNGGIPLVFGALTPAGLTQISGETAVGSQQTTFNAMGMFTGLLTDPFIDGRGEPVSVGAGAAQFADENDAVIAYASNGKPRSKSERDAYAAIYRKAPVAADPFTQRWSVWVAGYGGSQTTDGNAAAGSNNTTSRIYGTAVGADYRFSPNTIAGFALAGGGTNFSVANGGTGRSDLFQAGGFIRHTAGAAYISGALAYGWQDVTTDRTVALAGLDILRARFNANAFSGRVEGGYRFVTPWMNVGLTPYAAGQFTTFELPAYAEGVVAGANTFALSYAAKDVTASRSELGLRSDKSFAVQDGIFTLRGRAAWAHDFNPDRSISATFQTLPSASFVVNGAAQARDAALVTGSAEMKWLNGFSLGATFEGEFSNVTRSYAGKGVVRYAW